MGGKRRLNVTVVGGGYVGVSTACMFSSKHHVIIYDIDDEKNEKINSGISPIQDVDLKEWISDVGKNGLKATSDKKEAYATADIVFIAVPTDFNEDRNAFDTSLVRQTIEDIISFNRNSLIVIKSTVPIGFTKQMRIRTGHERIIFSPEFLREGSALKDLLSPSRIIVGADRSTPGLMKDAENYLEIVDDCYLKHDYPTLVLNSSEAEAIKLFSNSFLAMRIAFFNNLDLFAESRGLDTKEIIIGLGLDSRIGDYYNNPGFGYGGYCLPKDIRQLCSEYEGLPETLFAAVIDSNDKRVNFIAEQALKKAAELSNDRQCGDITIGFYRVNMKKNSDNYRQSATIGVLNKISDKGFRIAVYEPLLEEGCDFIPDECTILNDIEQFKNTSDIILANRYDSCLDDVKEKVYTRDLFNIN